VWLTVPINDLTKILQQFGRSWVDHLPYVEWSYNTTPISKTGMSPYFVFYVREPPLPSIVDQAKEEITDKSVRHQLRSSRRK
jgi:hypothetical protein